jgi:outer membrane protein assembly factor BamB
VQGFDPVTGERIWTSEVIGEGKVPSAVFGGGLVFTAGGWGGKETIKAFRLGERGDLKQNNLVWEQRNGMPKIPSMVYVDPYLFAITDDGVASCLDAATGEVQGQKRIGGNHSASPVLADGRIYFLSNEGETTIVQAAPQLQVLARNPLNENVQASMAVSAGRLFIRTASNLFCIRPAP